MSLEGTSANNQYVPIKKTQFKVFPFFLTKEMEYVYSVQIIILNLQKVCSLVIDAMSNRCEQLNSIIQISYSMTLLQSLFDNLVVDKFY
jgi:hypothetical protein